MNIDIELPTIEVTNEVLANRAERVYQRDNSVIGLWAKELQLTNCLAIRKAEIRENASYSGINMVIKMRTGTFNYTRNLVRLQIIPNTYSNKCVCCDGEEPEDAEHLLLRCNSFTDLREQCIPNITEKINNIYSLNAHINLIKKLLGEEGLTSGRKFSKEMLGTIKYLSWLLPKRAAIIAERKGDNNEGR